MVARGHRNPAGDEERTVIPVSVVRELPADWREQLFAGALLVPTIVLGDFNQRLDGHSLSMSPSGQRDHSTTLRRVGWRGSGTPDAS